MNCKPGDMAVMVECGVPAAIGLIVEVVAAMPPLIESLGPYWTCKAASGAKSDGGRYCLPGEICEIPDAWLRPIRDAGEPTSDATPTSLPTPVKEIA